MSTSDSWLFEESRLIQKFFPETKGLLHRYQPPSMSGLITAMRTAGLHADLSCDPWAMEHLELGSKVHMTHDFASKGGAEGWDAQIYARILNHTGFSPSGRVIVIADLCIVLSPYSFICHCSTVLERLQELKSFVFNCINDTVCVCESGHAFVLDRDHT